MVVIICLSDSTALYVLVAVIFQSLSRVRLFATPWTIVHQASLSFTISQSFLRLMSIESVMPSNHLVFSHPLLLLPSVFPNIGVFSNELLVWITWPEYWSFSFSISLSNDYSGLISFRIDWFDHLAVQGTLKSLLQYHSSKHQFFTAQPPSPTTGEIPKIFKTSMTRIQEENQVHTRDPQEGCELDQRRL